MAQTPHERYLKIGEVADLFKVGPKTVSRWAKAGKLPFIRTLGGQYRFPESAVRMLTQPATDEETTP